MRIGPIQPCSVGGTEKFRSPLGQSLAPEKMQEDIFGSLGPASSNLTDDAAGLAARHKKKLRINHFRGRADASLLLPWCRFAR